MFTPAEEAIHLEAIAFAKANHKAIVQELLKDAVTDTGPVSVFMAGAPGAGKTEVSLHLLNMLQTQEQIEMFRLDPDELRKLFPGYTGSNSRLFQSGVSVLVSKTHEQLLKKGVSFMMDGTLSSLSVARENISRSLKRGRIVQIFYVYQKPELSWRFVQEREVQEGRNIPLDVFIRQYFASRDVVNHLKNEFGDAIEVNVIVKNLDGSMPKTPGVNVESVDALIPETYTVEGLQHLLTT